MGRRRSVVKDLGAPTWMGDRTARDDERAVRCGSTTYASTMFIELGEDGRPSSIGWGRDCENVARWWIISELNGSYLACQLHARNLCDVSTGRVWRIHRGHVRAALL